MKIHQSKFIPFLGKNLSGVTKRYPRAIEKDGKDNLWDMKVLAGILRVDDPVTMVSLLASFHPGVWLDWIKRVEKEGCSPAEEAAIRNAHRELTGRISATAILDETGGQEIDPSVYSWRRYRENEAILKK